MTIDLDAFPTIKMALVSANVRGLKPHQDVPVQVDDLRALLSHHGAVVSRLRGALGFASSVIKSGEGWTDTCEREIGGALRGATSEKSVSD